MNRVVMLHIVSSKRYTSTLGVKMVEVEFECGHTARFPEEYMAELDIPSVGQPGGFSGGVALYDMQH